MTNKLFAAALTLLAPALALAQARPNDQPVTAGGPQVGGWILAIVAVAAVGFGIWAFRTMRGRGPQGPTPPAA
jgi:hypothetical protein